MGYKFGERSEGNLKGVHPLMIKIARRAIEITEQDFTVTEGVRTPERQRRLYAQGRTAPGDIVTWTLNSNHFVDSKTGYGMAIDAPPYPISWKGTAENLARFDKVAAAMFKAAKEFQKELDELGLELRWGADWDMDGKPRERGESDSPHFELHRRKK